MKNFIALLGWMGVVKLERLADYWSKSELFSIPFARSLMSRNRFQLLLRFWHFSDNEDPSAKTNRLHKLQPILDILIANFKKYYTPPKNVCIDESLIPFRGRLVFRMYIPNKSARYGVKVFKLCTEKGYTTNLKMYVGQSEKEGDMSITETTVMNLMEGLLDEGRTLFMDNYYNSIPLAYTLLERKTHLVGTLHRNRKYLPKELFSDKLKRGELRAEESTDGLTIVRWQDKREVLMITTKHMGNAQREVKTRNATIQKPICVLDYDDGKCPPDVSDQLAAYNKSLRKTTKWYRKMAIELWWGAALVNAYHLYNINSVVNARHKTITDFRLEVIKSMAKPTPTPNVLGRQSRNSNSVEVAAQHNLVVHPQKKRGRCHTCYDLYGKKGKLVDGNLKFASNVSNICNKCEGNPFFCKPCFLQKH